MNNFHRGHNLQRGNEKAKKEKENENENLKKDKGCSLKSLS